MFLAACIWPATCLNAQSELSLNFPTHTDLATFNSIRCLKVNL